MCYPLIISASVPIAVQAIPSINIGSQRQDTHRSRVSEPTIPDRDYPYRHPTEVQLDGTLAPLDLTAAGLALQADSADMKANSAGAVGISSLIADRRIQEQNTGHLPSKLREAAFERATVQILDKLQGHSVVGVLLFDY